MTAVRADGIFREQQRKNTAVRVDWVSKHSKQFMDSFEPPVFHELPLHVRQQTFPKYRGVALTKESLAPTVQLTNYYGGIGKLPPVQRAMAYQGKCEKTKAATINPPVWFGSSCRSIASTTHTDFPVKFRSSTRPW